MRSFFLGGQFLLTAVINFCLFLVVSAWNFLPLFVVELGGNKVDVGIVMGSIGATSLGSLPLLAPLIDRYGRKIFISSGILCIGLSNAGFLLFDTYSPLMVAVRLIQGVAFAACFNACATSIVDLVPPENRAQGIGLFGVSGSLAVSIGPFIAERILFAWDFSAYFLLLIGFGVMGFLAASLLMEPQRKTNREALHGFFLTAFHDGHISMMAMAVIFGAGFAAMNNFFPLFARELGMQAGIFFVCYGLSLLLIRLLFGQLADRLNREKLIFICLTAFGAMLVFTSQINSIYQTALLGILFGIIQGLSYPAMMARMVDRSGDHNRAVVVSLFTGSFGMGIHLSVFGWGVIADSNGLSFMFLVGGIMMFLIAAFCVFIFLLNRESSLDKASLLETKRTGSIR